MKVKTATIGAVDRQQKPSQALLLARTNLDAFKAFDFEDDVEFCPIANDEHSETYSSRSSTPNSVGSSFSTTPERNDFFGRNISPEMYFSPNSKFSSLAAATPLKERNLNVINSSQYSPQKFYSASNNNHIYGTFNDHVLNNAAIGASAVNNHASQSMNMSGFHFNSRNGGAHFGNNINNTNFLAAQNYQTQLNNVGKKRYDYANARSVNHNMNHNFRGGRIY